MSESALARIERMIYFIRGQKVMLDSDLAKLYEVETKYLNKAVKRNATRFPQDFMFQLTQQEYLDFNVLKDNLDLHGGRRVMPYVFTENGVAMLSSILSSETAVQMNISIMRIFTKMRNFLLLERDWSDRMSKLEKGTNQVFRIIFERLDSVEENLTPKSAPHKRKIGLHHETT